MGFGEAADMSPLMKKATSKTVAVLGASYGGYSAARHLADNLPKDWRLVVVDRNSHFNHLYVYPRLGVLTGHSHKGFIPYTHIFGSGQDSTRHVLLNAHITKLSHHSAGLSKRFTEHGVDGAEPSLEFDYAVYALGSHMPGPINLWGPAIDEEDVQDSASLTTPSISNVQSAQSTSSPSFSEVTTATTHTQDVASLSQETGTKSAGIEWLNRSSKYIENVPSVLVVGGGALGIQYATDIAEIYPNKSVTLLHSRMQLLPRFDPCMHSEIIAALSSLNVNTILGERLDLSFPRRTERNKDGHIENVVRTTSGREIRASVILLCTGQRPNTGFVHDLLPEAIIPDGPSKSLIRVNRKLQIGVPAAASQVDRVADGLSKLSVGDLKTAEPGDAELDVPHPHLFAIGDAADTFGAINAGHTAHAQALVAANNILKLIQAEESSSGPPELEEYHPGPPGIKMSIGRNTMLYQVGDKVGQKQKCPDDLGAPVMWKFYLGREVTEEEMLD
ncbi:hypothetical protein EUX98_g2115 [Antrodiella citrinella]|uniref:FAD/NAD(P)-binding domain-containing protein n=1 Tax=Antrodiella citrinella TaxID=2447956 RepID=A0A4V3XJ84_9APHY|nr:hypothetical protein EUX98_g2115 [Antrodiella citrinella]